MSDTAHDREILQNALAVHGHSWWASTMGVRMGLAAMRALGAARSGAKSLHAIVEIGDHHGAMCFGDGVQFATGCTFGKGNMEKSGKGKLGLTLIDKSAHKAVRVAYKPTLQKQIKESSFMRKRAAGVPPTEIPEEEQWELVNLVWNAPEGEVMTVGPMVETEWSEPEEVVRFAVCAGCGELVAEPYLRVVNGEPRCRDCSGYAV
jgi:formylmethanofuran dehydrogenase subunit E